MSLGILGMFGTIPFFCSSNKVLTFRNLNISHSSRFAKHDVIGETPLNEYIGPEQQKVTFDIQLRAAFGSSPSLCVMSLNSMLESGKAYVLIMGPDYFGKFVLTGFEEQRKYFSGLGASIATDVSLTLTEAKSFSLLSSLKSLI